MRVQVKLPPAVLDELDDLATAAHSSRGQMLQRIILDYRKLRDAYDAAAQRTLTGPARAAPAPNKPKTPPRPGMPEMPTRLTSPDGYRDLSLKENEEFKWPYHHRNLPPNPPHPWTEDAVYYKECRDRVMSAPHIEYSMLDIEQHPCFRIVSFSPLEGYWWPREYDEQPDGAEPMPSY